MILQNLLQNLFVRITGSCRFGRYRVTPRQNPRVFRREVLASILHSLKHEEGPTNG